ncbi:hypothetical protein VOLCADRAFT_118674, partial [Volvox carteri f. nagariensis]
MEHLSKAFAAVTRVSEVISRTAQSAQELLRDQELRSKGIQTVLTGAQTRLQGIQNGIAQRAGRIQERLLDKRRQLQGFLMLLHSLEERFNATQRAWQLQARRRDPVDVQFGRQVFENAPQCEHPGAVQNMLMDDDDDVDDDDANDGGGNLLDGGGGGGGTPSLTRGSVSSVRDSGGAAAIPSSGSTASRFAAVAAALGFARPISGSALPGSPSATSLSSLSRRERSVSGKFAAADTASEAAQQQQQQQPYTPVHTRTHQIISGANPSSPPPPPPSSSPAGGAAGPPSVRTSRGAAAGGILDDGWELVGGVWGTTDASGLPGSEPLVSGPTGGPPQPEAIRIILERLDALGHLALDESGSDPVLVAQQAVLEAMMQVPWEGGVGLPADYPAESRFAVLNEMTAGQEEVDDSILRDIHRTFPEHPYFGMEAGQRSLFRVLKAYSLHDLEVAYCQGMAFMAGVLLMYVPEEIAFRLFCRLMDPEGPNLRRLYLPGLDPLKAMHLSEYGLPPVLYVSQWLMTLFATPFPPAFCARVIDVLLQDGHDRLLLRCSFAIMEVLEPGLLARHDFEALITYLKVLLVVVVVVMEPVTWGLGRQRAIMERALASPLTDAEIDVARDTVANRKFLAAALAAGSTSGSAAAGGDAATAAPEVLGSGGSSSAATAAEAADPSAAMHQRKLSLEAEVDAALEVAAAAAALTAAADVGAAGCSRGGLRDWDADGRGGAGAAGVCAARTAARGRFGPEGGDMISFEEEEGTSRFGAAGSAGYASAAAELPSCSGGGSSAPPPGGGWEPEWPVGHQMSGAGSHHHSGVEPASSSTATGATAARRPCGSGCPSYGISPSLLDDLDLGCGGGGAAAIATGRKAPDLEYGEYGEMLMDAGVLLPE